MRLTSVMFALMFLAVAYVTARRMLGHAVALMTLGFLSIGFWPLMASRAGERNIMLALFTALTIYAFCRASWRPEIGYRNFALAGMALGATLWTYQSGRTMPIVFLAYGLYLAAFERETLHFQWKGIVIFLVVGVLIASPLFVYLATHPGVEVGDFKTQSLQALQQSNWKPLVSAALGTLGLFTVRGEIYWLHNIPGRPIFDVLIGALFYLGLVAALVRWKRREYALLLLWLLIGLIPAMITDPPSHHRMANVMAAAYILPALGADWIRHSLALRFTPHASRFTLYALTIIGLVSWAGFTTARDFFARWAIAPEVQSLHFSKLAQLSRDLDRDPDTSPVVVAGTYIEDIEPLVPVALMKRKDIAFRWYDAATTQIIPSATRARYFDPGSDLRVVDTDALRREALDRAAASADVWLAPPGDALPTSVGAPTARPIVFDDRIELLGVQVETPHIVTYWRVRRDGSPSSTAMFLHLTTSDLKIIAQDDRLGFPTHSWRAGDVFAQTFILNVPASVSGQAWLELGIYDRPTKRRWQVTGAPGVNRVLSMSNGP
jgi:hypothetical protein